jgi:serine-type D-Ala-D-Ala carboxypeptidase/endopeptidase (penicillin-binding protein 4)
VPLAGVRIVDGSGLSPANRLTAAAVIGILVVAWNDPAMRPSFVRSLAVAGVSGTLEDRLERPPARGTVLAKTGTLRESSALSGYVRGRWAFAVIQNGRPVSQFWARRAQDRFASVLAAQ